MTLNPQPVAVQWQISHAQLLVLTSVFCVSPAIADQVQRGPMWRRAAAQAVVVMLREPSLLLVWKPALPALRALVQAAVRRRAAARNLIDFAVRPAHAQLDPARADWLGLCRPRAAAAQSICWRSFAFWQPRSVADAPCFRYSCLVSASRASARPVPSPCELRGIASGQLSASS